MSKNSKTKRGLSLVLIIICVVNILSCCVITANAKGSDTTKIRVAFPNQDGMSEANMDGNYSGYSYEYLSKISEYTGYDIEYITFPDMSVDESIMKAMEMVQNGDADLIGGMLKSPALEEMYDYCDRSYGLVYTTLSALDGNADITEDTVRSISPLRVAVLEKATTRNEEIKTFLETENVKYELIFCKDGAEQLACLENGDADVISSVSLSYFEGTRTVASFAARPFYFAATKGNGQIVSKIDDALYKIAQAFPYLQSDLFNKYFDRSKSEFYLSSDEKLYLIQKKYLNVLCIANSDPYIIKDENGNMCGVSVEILNDFASEAGIEIHYDYFDYTTSFLDALNQKDYDIVLGIPTNVDSNYNKSYTNSKNALYVRSRAFDSVDMVSFRKHSLNKPLSECVVALVQGSLYGETLDCKQIVYGKNTQEIINMVEKGQADVGYNNFYTVNYYLSSMYSNLVTAPESGHTMDICFTVSNEDGNVLLSIINSYIGSVSATKLDSYYNDSTAYYHHTYIQDMMHSNPVLFASILLILAVCIICVIFLFISASRKKKQYVLIEQASIAKTNFFSRMSHDMRTPMNAILGFAELGRQEADGQQSIEYFTNIKDSGSYLLGLINDTLDMSKIEQNKIELHLEPYDYNDFEATIDNMLLPKAKQNGVNFVIKNDNPCKVCVEFDKMRLQQVFVNLIGNAIKFTPKGGTVEFEIIPGEETPDKRLPHTFIVRDNGIGMSEKFVKNKLFKPFEQEHSDIIQNETGTGLGVSIAKNIVELMGGSIRCESALGKGTTFTIELCPKISTNVVETSKEIQNVDETVLIGKQVLLCEDHPMNIQIAVKLLQKKDIKVTVAHNGQEGISLFEESEIGFYDAILMDVRMPVMDGLEAAEKIRASERPDAKTIPIIALSANAFDEDVQKSKAVGMNAHLAKPIDPSLLYKTLSEEISERKKI